MHYDIVKRIGWESSVYRSVIGIGQVTSSAVLGGSKSRFSLFEEESYALTVLRPFRTFWSLQKRQ